MSGTTITRRSFLKTTGILAGAGCLAGGSYGALSAFAESQEGEGDGGEQLFNCN